MLDINSNRSSKKYSNTENLLRVAWAFGKVIFRLTPRPLYSTRSLILRMFGAKVGKHVHIYNSAQIYMPWNFTIGDWSSIGEEVLIYNLGKINIGSRATISHRSHLCAGTHDYNKPDLPLLKLSIDIKDEVWVCAAAFIGPNVTINEGAVIGACSVIVKDVDAMDVMAGNPASRISKRSIIRDGDAC